MNITVKLLFLMTFGFMVSGCIEKIEEDPCLKTSWPQTKVFEMKIAVHLASSPACLPGGVPGSNDPADFNQMIVSGTIGKIACSGEKSDYYSLGKTSITKGLDMPAPINVIDAFWISYVVYVYELGNDNDHLDIILSVKVTMPDNQSYMCNFSDMIYYPQIVLVPGEMYYYVLMDINSDSWVKV